MPSKILKENCKPCNVASILLIIVGLLVIIKTIIRRFEKYQNIKQKQIDQFYEYAAKYRINQEKMEHHKFQFEESYNNYLKSKTQLSHIMNQLS
jgi:hypothetical protein